MKRAVIDTNVLVSALLKAHGAEAAVLFAVADKKIGWCVSPAILKEYEDVLRRPKFSQVPRAYVNTLLAIAGRAERFTPTITAALSPHEPDNRFLECAEAAEADYLVTGNARHFPRLHKTTQIVNARQLLDSIAAEESQGKE